VPRFLTIRQVAAELGLSPWTVYRRIRLGELRAIRMGRMWRVAAGDLEAYRDSKKPPPPA
jgi:excisionase family DNA binding protein